ncbi:MAG: PbpA [Desulfamplus sp.]|nr:PbpA [Desulfamplus sp.]
MSISRFSRDISTQTRENPIKSSTQLRAGRVNLKKKSDFKKRVLYAAIIISAMFILQKSIPVLISGTKNIAIDVLTFFKDDASLYVKQLALSIKTKSESVSLNNLKQKDAPSEYISKHDLKTILQPYSLLNLEDNIFTVGNMNTNAVNTANIANLIDNKIVSSQKSNNNNLTISTTLDMRLQHFLLEQIESLSLLDKGKPEIIAMVAMEPHTGKILAMAGFDSHSPDTNPCTDGAYPAASLFKMVTASAAVETCGYSPATTMYFSGGKYTLYKRQLSDQTNIRFLNKVTLAEAFAQSINPVFGKLGSIMLGKDVLEKYANSFGFNQEIDSEIDFKPGNFTITDDNTYQWAEVACGFNTTTTISPIFGAMIASTMLNSGKTPVPCIVESVKDDNGKLLYKRKDAILNNTVKPDTAKAMMQMMNGTVITGTARKSFRGADKDNVLSRLNMGGKTGSLSSYDNSIKFDWFSGFCTDSQEKQQIVVSVLVGHGKYIGTKASIYGRLIFKEYFNNYFALNSQQLNNG